MTELKIITTEDGSHSLYRKDLHETYHSFHGAKGESLHVFIENGLRYAFDRGLNEISVFEVGLGTGLNALLAANFAKANKIPLDYHTIEPIPVPEEIYKQLNYGGSSEEDGLLQQIHQSVWEQKNVFSDFFRLTKYEKKLEEMDLNHLWDTFDVIFFDAFAPSKQAELWEVENLKKCYELLKSGGVLTTYCAQGQFKRNLAAAGFEVQTLKGALGKKEMVRGLKIEG